MPPVMRVIRTLWTELYQQSANVAEPVVLRARAVFVRVQIEAMLAFLPLDTLLEKLTPRSEHPSHGEGKGVFEQIARATERLPGLRSRRTTCLIRALTRYTLLRRRGINAAFVMGVRTAGGDVEGHAWIEVGGDPVMEHEAPDFEVTFRFPRIEQG